MRLAVGTSGKRLRRRAAAAAVAAGIAVGIVLAACAPAGSAGKPATPQSRGVVSLTRISRLRAVFNREAGHPRLLLILSPT